MIVYRAFLPHPPIVIPAVGGENLKKCAKTVESLITVAEEFAAFKADTTIIFSPHHLCDAEKIPINISDDYYGDFASFGAPNVKMEILGDSEFAKSVVLEAEGKKIPVGVVSEGFLDHGVMVPLYYPWQRGFSSKIIVIGYSMIDLEVLYNFGKFLQDYCERSNRKYVMVASGDLSHCLSESAPERYHPQGKEFDKQIVEIIENVDHDQLMNLDKNLIDNAAQCGLRSLIMLFGTMHNRKVKSKVLSYEGPFGVGYAVATFKEQ